MSFANLALMWVYAWGVPSAKENAMTKRNDTILQLDKDLRAFLRECAGCQSLAISNWARRLLKAREMTLSDMERCLNLGFEF